MYVYQRVFLNWLLATSNHADFNLSEVKKVCIFNTGKGMFGKLAFQGQNVALYIECLCPFKTMLTIYFKQP